MKASVFDFSLVWLADKTNSDEFSDEFHPSFGVSIESLKSVVRGEQCSKESRRSDECRGLQLGEKLTDLKFVTKLTASELLECFQDTLNPAGLES